MRYADSLQKVLEALKPGERLSDFFLRQEAAVNGTTEEEVFRRMEENLKAMEEAAEKGLRPGLKSVSGLTGGDAFRVKAAGEAGKLPGGALLNGLMYRALAVAELNAAMGRVVAAPTAGSCGILPAVILTVGDAAGADRKARVMALVTAGGVGYVIARRASLSGAECGCQAECGSAAAMAAAAAAELAGGTPEMSVHACALALKNHLGLACDPVAGLVEVPCVKRNAFCASAALVAANLALAGVRSVIPADEVMDAMKAIGKMMPAAIRETAEGGLADTPTGRRLADGIFGRD